MPTSREVDHVYGTADLAHRRRAGGSIVLNVGQRRITRPLFDGIVADPAAAPWPLNRFATWRDQLSEGAEMVPVD